MEIITLEEILMVEAIHTEEVIKVEIHMEETKVETKEEIMVMVEIKGDMVVIKVDMVIKEDMVEIMAEDSEFLHNILQLRIQMMDLILTISCQFMNLQTLTFLKLIQIINLTICMFLKTCKNLLTILITQEKATSMET